MGKKTWEVNNTRHYIIEFQKRRLKGGRKFKEGSLCDTEWPEHSGWRRWTWHRPEIKHSVDRGGKNKNKIEVVNLAVTVRHFCVRHCQLTFFQSKACEEKQLINGDNQLWACETELITLLVFMRTLRLREVNLVA